MNKKWTMSFLMAGAMALAAGTATTVHADGQPLGLFELDPQPGQELALLTVPGIHPYLKALLNDPATEQLRLINLTPDVVAPETRMLTVPLPDGRQVSFQLRRSSSDRFGMVGWVGDMPSDRKKVYTSDTEVDIDPLNWISLVRDGDQLMGSIHVEGQPYRLEYVGAGRHVLVKVDESGLPPEAKPLAPPESPSDDGHVGELAQSAHSIIRVLFVTTDQSRAKYPNNRALLAQALQDANQYMINSQIDISYELAGYYDASYNEDGQTYSQQLSSLRNAQDNLGKSVYKVRDALGADLVSMLSTGREYCGLAYVNAAKASAYSVVSCAASLGHELGHNLGATHNWEPGDPLGSPPYMFGYRYTGTPRFRTQMSYACTSGGVCPRIANHSNPRLTYQGVPTGTSSNHDVARRFNERRAIVENFYPPFVQSNYTAD